MTDDGFRITHHPEKVKRFTMMTDHDDDELAAGLGELLGVYPVLRYFTWAHLPEPLRPTSRAFATLALDTARRRPTGHPETATALRKLLEAKDAAVRADLPDLRSGNHE